MKVLVTGSREFHAHYRVERGIKAAMDSRRDGSDRIVQTLYLDDGQRLRRRGAERLARDVADEYGWASREYNSLNEAQPDVCLAFYVKGEEDVRTRRTAMQAEKSGIPVWRYFL
jgi:hypothetical protein